MNQKNNQAILYEVKTAVSEGSKWVPSPMEVTFIREVTARYIGPRRALVHIQEPKDIFQYALGVLKDNVREHFMVLYLDGAHRVIAHSLLATGSANSCPVHPRELFQLAVLCGAVAVAAVHNHPSGMLEPSSEDRMVTERLRDCGKLLGIRLLDHVIMTDSEFRSI